MTIPSEAHSTLLFLIFMKNNDLLFQIKCSACVTKPLIEEENQNRKIVLSGEGRCGSVVEFFTRGALCCVLEQETLILA